VLQVFVSGGAPSSCTELPEFTSIDSKWSDNYLKVYPNPLQSDSKINIVSEQIISGYTVYDIFGKIIMQRQHINSAECIVETDVLASGMYFLQVNYDAPNISQTMKILKGAF
jgi:hypothetical protein